MFKNESDDNDKAKRPLPPDRDKGQNTPQKAPPAHEPNPSDPPKGYPPKIYA